MKTPIITLLIIAGFFLFSCGGSGQMKNEVLGNVQDPNRFDTMALLRMDENISVFADLVEMSGLNTSMMFTDSFTVFIPTNEAFGEMEVSRFEELTSPQNREELLQFVSWHFMPNQVYSTQFEDNQIIQTHGEEVIMVSTSIANAINIGGASIIRPDIKTADGLVHIVDAVIQPTSELDRMP